MLASSSAAMEALRDPPPTPIPNPDSQVRVRSGTAPATPRNRLASGLGRTSPASRRGRRGLAGALSGMSQAGFLVSETEHSHRASEAAGPLPAAAIDGGDGDE